MKVTDGKALKTIFIFISIENIDIQTKVFDVSVITLYIQ